MVASPRPRDEPWSVNLHDWIDELMDVLDIEVEMDEGLVLDVARQAAHRVQRPAAPISTFLLGYAAGLAEGGTEEIEGLAARVLALAESWEGGEPEPDLDVEVDETALVDAD